MGYNHNILGRIHRIFKSHKKKVLFCGFVALLMTFLSPEMHSLKTYEYIFKEDILDNLHEEILKNFTSNSVNECDYLDVINDDSSLSVSLVDGDLVDGHRISAGGEFSPQECKPKFSSAIIVPYRDRPEELRAFLVHMHTFLRHQKINYRIFVIEQLDSSPFNQAKLINIGAVAAMKVGYPCLILHDPVLLPMKASNLYACTEEPRHMTSGVPSNNFRFIFPSTENIGGVISILAEQFKTINGMSNQNTGWGNDDDDFYFRMKAYGLGYCHFEPKTNVYHIQNHEPQRVVKEGNRLDELLLDDKALITSDGLSSLKYTEVATVLHPLFTHIMVDL